MNSKTTHCGVGPLAADMQVMATFYRDVLGLETDWDGGNFVEFYTASGRLVLFMYDRKMFDEAMKPEFRPPRGHQPDLRDRALTARLCRRGRGIRKTEGKGCGGSGGRSHHLALRYPQFLHCRPGGQSAGDRQRHDESSRKFGKFGINFL